ncbi:MHYT domain-containing protein [Phenylobacterium deserti]|uniref:histidine kinase n=1 Tax=Phenylobacterium deserti TaxID=1914756 RepID=A0A328ACK4_9CAUL|nr:MHYT domain-containing protein [Phenylobacterium deserti]RAK52543.1 hypothetical protein DJ018_10030 [Phenylobacterium deserti]
MVHHHPVFLFLSMVVAVFGSWTALDLFRRVRSHIGRTRLIWLGAAAVAMGASIWSMHFVAMLGFDPGSPVSYDLPLTFLSLSLAIGATCGAFFAAAHERAKKRSLLVSGLAMGIGICLMHYVGMAALSTAVSLGHDIRLVGLSFVIAVLASTAALFAARRERSLRWRGAAAVILGAAIVGMHYTAMAGLKLTHAGGAHSVHGAPPFVLAAVVAGGTILVLALALLASLYDQRLNVLAALEAGGVGYWELALPRKTLHVSSKGKEILGRSADEPFGEAELLNALEPAEHDRRTRLLDHAINNHVELDAEYRLRPVGNAARWINVRGRVVNDAAGRPRRMVGVVLDVTERREAFTALAESDRRQRLLIDELNHRVKNTLATVQSIARQTAKTAESIEDFSQLFEARLLALSNTHNVLTRGSWESASLREILEQELHPYDQQRVVARGPAVRLPARHALALGMVLHEMTTNAAKYGALSAESGQVEVDWKMLEGSQGGDLEITWRETGGPTVQPPKRRGFGSRLVQGSAAELGGRAEVEYAPEGLRMRLTMPLPDPEPASGLDVLAGRSGRV